MTNADDLRNIMRRLPEIYKEGDIAGYLSHYAPDITANYSGALVNSNEARAFLKSLFAGNGKTLSFQMGEPQIQFSENEEAAIVRYPWREHFQYDDGRETDIEYYETDVWYRRNGEWKIAHVHQSTTKEHPITN